MTTAARAIEILRDQRLRATSRRGLVRITASSRATSAMGISRRGPNSNDSGSKA